MSNVNPSGQTTVVTGTTATEAVVGGLISLGIMAAVTYFAAKAGAKAGVHERSNPHEYPYASLPRYAPSHGSR